jgi:hypothetical protein
MLNCTKHDWNTNTEAKSSTLDRQQLVLDMENTDQDFTFTAGSRIRMMKYPEISRYNGWSDFTSTEADFAFKIKNKTKYTGAFYFDAWPLFGPDDGSFITWAFFEEILINQFFAPMVSYDNKTPDPANIMMLRSCNVIEDMKDRSEYYNAVASKNKWVKISDKLNQTFYESVRIGFNEHLRSTNGGVLWIPGYPEPPNKKNSATKGLRGNYDHFQCSMFSTSKTTSDKDQEDGYLRNLMINTNAIKESFMNANVVEDGIRDLLGKMNEAACDYWNLTLQCDENDGGTQLKVIDSNWVEKSVKEIKQKAGASDVPSLEDTTFRFPIYSNNTISSGVNMSSQLPDSLKAAVFVGGNKYKKSWHKSDEEEIPVFTEDVIDRYHHFGPFTKKGLTETEKKEEIAQKKLVEDKKKEVIEDAEDDLGDVKMTEAVQAATAAYIKSQLYLDPSPYNQYRNNRMIPVNLSLDLDGIGGIYFGNCFTISKLPTALDDRLLFQIKNVTHTVNNDLWKTAIESICRIGEKQESSDRGEYFINQERETSKADSASKYKIQEDARKAKQKELDDAVNAAEAESNQGGKNIKANRQTSEVSKELKSEDVHLRSDVNVNTTTITGAIDSTETRKSAKDGEKVTKLENVPVKPPSPTPKELEEQAAAAAKIEAAKRHVQLMTPWFTNDGFPGAKLGGKKQQYGTYITRQSLGIDDGTGLEDVTLYSEQEANISSGTGFALGTEIMSHSVDREALVLSTHSAAYRILKTITTDDNVLLILQDMEKYKTMSQLLMWLQMFHLHCINHDFRDWKDAENDAQKDYNGNIFKWAKYEKTYLDDKERKVTYSRGEMQTVSPAQAGFKTLLNWDGTSDYGNPGGVQFFELGITEPVHYNKRGEGNATGIYNWPTKKGDKNQIGSSQLDDSLFLNDPEWHPWGPQWHNERGFYYIAGEPGGELIESRKV